MSALAVIPNVEERARDELCLTVLNCWEDGWTCGEIAKQVPTITRNSALGIVWRVFKADPGNLKRKPQSQGEGPS